MSPVDLRNYPPYRCYHEPEGRKARKTDDPWDLVLRGRKGFIAPCGGEYLLACTNHLLTTRRLLKAVPDAVITQDGSDGQNVRFHVNSLAAVAKILVLRRRRVFTPAEKARRAAGLAKIRRYR
jgi:hypothetical protein